MSVAPVLCHWVLSPTHRCVLPLELTELRLSHGAHWQERKPPASLSPWGVAGGPEVTARAGQHVSPLQSAQAPLLPGHITAEPAAGNHSDLSSQFWALKSSMVSVGCNQGTGGMVLPKLQGGRCPALEAPGLAPSILRAHPHLCDPVLGPPGVSRRALT